MFAVAVDRRVEGCKVYIMHQFTRTLRARQPEGAGHASVQSGVGFERLWDGVVAVETLDIGVCLHLILPIMLSYLKHLYIVFRSQSLQLVLTGRVQLSKRNASHGTDFMRLVTARAAVKITVMKLLHAPHIVDLSDTST